MSSLCLQFSLLLLSFVVFSNSYTLRSFGDSSKRSIIGHVPRSGLMIGERGFGPGSGEEDSSSENFEKGSYGTLQSKRGFEDIKKFIPRSGLMISGRGFMPGFADSRDFGAFYRRRRDAPVPLGVESEKY